MYVSYAMELKKKMEMMTSGVQIPPPIPPPSHLFLLSFLNFLPYKVSLKSGISKASGIKEVNAVYLGRFIYSVTRKELLLI